MNREQQLEFARLVRQRATERATKFRSPAKEKAVVKEGRRVLKQYHEDAARIQKVNA
jgi:hypothetical protein